MNPFKSTDCTILTIQSPLLHIVPSFIYCQFQLIKWTTCCHKSDGGGGLCRGRPTLKRWRLHFLSLITLFHTTDHIQCTLTLVLLYFSHTDTHTVTAFSAQLLIYPWSEAQRIRTGAISTEGTVHFGHSKCTELS